MPNELVKRLLGMACAGLLAPLLGCGNGAPRGAVEGMVTFDDKPIVAGIVSFESADGTSPARNVPIHNGMYRADGDAGLVPGRYRVRIAAGDLDAEASWTGNTDAQHAPVAYRPLLPPSWNVQSQLSVEVRDGRNAFHFSGKKDESPRVTLP